jgi:hypothetical protein
MAICDGYLWLTHGGCFRFFVFDEMRRGEVGSIFSAKSMEGSITKMGKSFCLLYYKHSHEHTLWQIPAHAPGAHPDVRPARARVGVSL